MAKLAKWSPVGMGKKSRMGCYDARPRSMMGNSGTKGENLGVGILAALSIAGLHSAVCPSFFTQAMFSSQPEAKSRAMEGLWISLGLSTVASIAIYSVWDNLQAGLFAEATALALFGIGIYAVNKEPPKTIPSIEKQNTGSPMA